ncbi:protein YgfX [Serratia microhaemolytica]|uniref:protein YgfX n=1 Tax=Serratia microhaemolytica TaxID=2675110 RepID=UPI000FDCECED|nr:protein YgfX [Serratia microhaemolytica]
MAPWRCDVRVSWHTQLFSLMIHGLLILLVLILPWPEGYSPLWLMLLVLLVFECTVSQKKIAFSRGEFWLCNDQYVKWHDEEWTMRSKPWISRFGILFSLQQVGGKHRCRLWLASDALHKEEWRHLNQLLRNDSISSGEKSDDKTE